MNQPDILSLREASVWATNHLGKTVTTSNISYLVQYGCVKKFDDSGTAMVSKVELEQYYSAFKDSRETKWRDELGENLNWTLSFDKYTESETTKHVHRLHPYKGKFIPQLVEYFLDAKTDTFKKEVFFKPGDIVLDPFCGSGTTLVQANELGIHAVGIDVSGFNAFISNVKVSNVDFFDLRTELNRITSALRFFIDQTHSTEFELRLMNRLSEFNAKWFPVPDYKYRLRRGEINEVEYGSQKEIEFLPEFQELTKKFHIKLRQENNTSFLETWFLQAIREEIDFVFDQIKTIENSSTKQTISLVLSRTMRSCRATTHADLATLVDPISATYYCSKHGKICKPLFTIFKWWETYAKDTLNRLSMFNSLRTSTQQACVTGDSQNVELKNLVEMRDGKLAELIANQGIAGIFSSPPYVGLINYHEQHAYAYDLFGYERNDESEIGPLFRGQGSGARAKYVDGISKVLLNAKNYLSKDYNVFLVSNDKYNLYPTIAQKAGMRIVDQFLRPVLNRSEKDKGAYSEIIFHLKEASA